MPRRSYGGRPTPRAAPVRNPPQSEASHACPPAPAQSGNGGSILGAIGTIIAEGMAFGTGSEIAHRVVETLLGPRTIQHKTVVFATTALEGSHSCIGHSKAFDECLTSNESDIRKCQLYVPGYAIRVQEEL